MENLTYEPFPQAPRPCSTPHSAPVEWLKDANPDTPPPEPLLPSEIGAPTLTPEQLDEFATALRSNPGDLADFIERLSPEETREDGWSPFLRKLFLQVLAETGKVTLACEYAGMSRQSAYALAARDPVFAAGWDAAALIRRNPLADLLYEQAMDGVTDTVMREGKVVATRHRFDTRLSIAVLHRLDKRCDRAEELGSAHLAVVQRWDEYLDRVGKGDSEGAKALIAGGETTLEGNAGESAPDCQKCQLPETANPTVAAIDWDTDGLSEHFHKNRAGEWLTTFAPPPDFDGYENCPFDALTWYERSCTAEEIALIEAHEAAEAAAIQAEEEEDIAFAHAQREEWLAASKAKLGVQSPSAGEEAEGEDSGAGFPLSRE